MRHLWSRRAGGLALTGGEAAGGERERGRPRDTWGGVRCVLPMSVGSVDAGDGRPECAGVGGGSRALGSAPRDPPVLPGRSEQSSAAQRRRLEFWVLQVSPEVGGAGCRPLDRAEASGGQLEVRRVDLKGRNAVLETVGGVCRWSEVRPETAAGCLWWKASPVVGEKAEGRVLLVGGVLASNGAESERM